MKFEDSWKLYVKDNDDIFEFDNKLFEMARFFFVMGNAYGRMTQKTSNKSEDKE